MKIFVKHKRNKRITIQVLFLKDLPFYLPIAAVEINKMDLYLSLKEAA